MTAAQELPPIGSLPADELERILLRLRRQLDTVAALAEVPTARGPEHPWWKIDQPAADLHAAASALTELLAKHGGVELAPACDMIEHPYT